MGDSMRALRFNHRYVLPYRRWVIAAQLILLLSRLLAIAIPLVVREAIDFGVLNHNPQFLVGAAGIVLLVGAVSASLLYIGKRIRFTVSGRVVGDLRRDLLSHLMKLGPTEVDEATGGQALARLTTDSAGLRAVVNGGLIEIVNQVLLGAAVLVVCLAIDWRITLITMIPMLVAASVSMHVQLRLVRVFQEIRGHFSALLAGVVESLANAAVVKTFGREAHAAGQLGSINEVMAERRRHMRMKHSAYGSVTSFINALPMPIAIWLGAHAVVAGRLSVGSLVALIALIMMLQMSVHMMTMDSNGVLHSVVNGERILKLLGAPPALRGDRGSQPVPALTGRVTAHDVSTAIGGRQVLDGVDVSIAPGEFVALVGPTGSGKSVLLHVLARLTDPAAGTVRYDGHDARDFDPALLRRQIVCLPQRQWIFDGSLADNIAFVHPAATANEIAGAAERAGIGHLPLDRILGTGAGDLSAGERQRVGLARALLLAPPILLLDNPTANLDGETEAAFIDTLLTLRGTRTLIVATQHMALARQADRVITLDKGRIRSDAGQTDGAGFLDMLRAMDLAAAQTDGSKLDG